MGRSTTYLVASVIAISAVVVGIGSATAEGDPRIKHKAHRGYVIQAWDNGGSTLPVSYGLPRSASGPVRASVTLPNGFQAGVPTDIVVTLKYEASRKLSVIPKRNGWGGLRRGSYRKLFGLKPLKIVFYYEFWSFGEDEAVGDDSGPRSVGFKARLRPGRSVRRVLKVLFPKCTAVDRSAAEWWRGYAPVPGDPGWPCRPGGARIAMMSSIFKKTRDGYWYRSGNTAEVGHEGIFILGSPEPTGPTTAPDPTGSTSTG